VLRRRVEVEVSDAVAYALDAPYPDASEVTEDVFA
jgi:TPP-dependent pyruvate/acetoin dehydrogenase alpha subunit